MDVLRAAQLLTDFAYICLGVAAARAALRVRERVRADVVLLFGTLAAVVVIQEIGLLSCASAIGCVTVPAATMLSGVLILVLPYALLRLLDDVADVPPWQMWLTLVMLIVLSVVIVLSAQNMPGWVVALLLAYLIVGTAYPAWGFVRRARRTRGITRRRMAAVAWGCGFLALTFILSLLSQAGRELAPLSALSRLSGLISGASFWAGFFPPTWLSQAWRLPELLEYLRPARLMAGAPEQPGLVTEAVALDRLTAATAHTTGAQRVLLLMRDAAGQDLYLWGAPSARVEVQDGLVGEVLTARRARVVSVGPEALPASLSAVFGSEPLPRTAMLVPVIADGQVFGILAAFADKGPMFVDDDLEVVSYFAGEAAAILQLRALRATASELEALREADRLKDEFMAVVSHELRTPLTAISGYADILLRKLSGPLNERQEGQVTGIRDASRRLLALINDLLDVSKLEAGTLDLHLAPVDALRAVERAATSTRVIAASKGVQLEVRQPPAPLPPARADDERLQQILSNLLMNAIKFTPQGGSVWVETSVEASPTGDGTQEILFRVQDTGVGLSPGQADRVWDRFYQVESSSTRRFGGAGLGLSIVRRLTELHSGRVEATSAGVNRGSTFEVRLPAYIGPDAEPVVLPTPPTVTPAATPAAATALPATKGEHDGDLILVVEDDLPIATVLRTYLEADGYQVQVVSDGLEAIHTARTQKPFAITLDISLPKLDGWSVLNALKRDPSTAQIPVVIISIVDNRDFGFVLGATEYMVKPIDHQRLQSVLRVLHPAASMTDGPVLVVDDDPAMRDILSSSLQDHGWRAATAVDGESALAAIERERPSAVVLDLMMPRVDGFEVLRAVRARPATRDLPVVVITAKELTEEDRRRLAESAQAVILKQAMRLEDVLAEVRRVLAQYATTRDNGGTPS